MYNFEENQSSSEYRTENIINEYAAPIPGSGLFFNNETRRVSHWSVPWSDLMMTMFVLFAVLYVYHAARKDVQATPGKPRVYFQEEIKPVQAEDVSRADTETLRIEDIRDISSIELTKEKTVKIILPGDVLFDTGEAELKPGAVSSLMAVGQLIQDTDYAVTVAGHTDNIPIQTEKYPSNWELSTARACVAARFLIDETDIQPSQIQVTGYAENRPIDTNETPSGRSANRRVEVIISKEHLSDNLKSL